MLKKTIVYTDFDGVQRTEDFYFHLSKTEILEMEISIPGGMSGLLERIVAALDIKEIAAVFKEIVLKAYGEKSSDGKRFIKSKELSEEFAQTEAFSDLFVELVTNEAAAADFVNAIIPQAPIQSTH